MASASHTPDQRSRVWSAVICLLVPGMIGLATGGIVDQLMHTRPYLGFLGESEDVIVWTEAWHYSDEVFLYFLGYIALILAGLFLWFIWWIWNEPDESDVDTKRQRTLSYIPRVLTIPTVLVLGIAGGFIGNRWFVEREFEGLRFSRPALEQPWQESAAFYPEMLFTVVFGLTAVWGAWLIARQLWSQLLR